MLNKKNRNFEFVAMDRLIELSLLLCVAKMDGLIELPYFYLLIPGLIFPCAILLLVFIAMASMIIKSFLNKIIYDRNNA